MTDTVTVEHDDVAQHEEPARAPGKRRQVATRMDRAVVENPEPMNLIAMAVSRGADITVIEKLVALQERMEANAARRAFDEAIASARADIPVIVKNRRVKFESKKADVKDGKVDYAHEDLAQIAEQIDPVLSKHGLSYRFRTTQKAEQPVVSVTCIISHRQGHSEETSLFTAIDTSGSKNHIQGIGSVVTYLQRYTLKAALGLAAAEQDDDGQTATSVEPTTQQAGPPRASAQRQAAPTQQTTTQQAGPREIVPVKGDTFSSWGLRYVEGFKTANTPDELRQWDKINDPHLTKIYNGAKATYEEINAAYRHHMSALEAKARPQPRPAAEVKSAATAPAEQQRDTAPPKWTSPDPDKEYEAWLKWAQDQLVNWDAPIDDLVEFWATMVEPFSVFPSDLEDLQGLYRKAEKRLEE